MATYVNDLRLKEIATGDESGTWGTSTNTNLELIAEAFSFGTEAITTNADTHTTTIADGSTDPGRSLYLKYTGTLDSACTITIGPNTVSKLWFIENGTSGSQNIIISQGSGANITIPPGDVKAVYSDGAGSGAAVVDAFASLNVVDLKVQDDLTVTDDATVGGTLGVTGILTCTDDIIIGDGKTIGSASDVDAMTIASNGQVTFTQTLIGTALDISGDIDVDGTTNLDVVDIDGAVDMASTLAVGGVVTANAGVVVDNITIDGTEIDLSSGDLTIDVAGDIILNADGGDIRFRDGSTEVGTIVMDDGSNTFILKSAQSDADIKFNGNDGGSGITALTLDMSDAGRASFNNKASFNNAIAIGQSTFTGGNTLVDIHGSGSGVGANIAFANDHNTDKFFVGISGDTSGDALIYNAENSNMIFGTNNSERMRIDSSGNLGLGTTSPDSELHVLGSGGGNGDVNVERTSGAKIHTQAQSALGVFGTSSNHDLAFKTNDTQRMRIDSSGNLGIGTTSPSELLEVSKSTDGATIRISSTQNDSSHSTTTPFGILEFHSSDSSGAGAGVRGSVKSMPASTTGGAADLVFSTANSTTHDVEMMRITDAGNVGIGNATPDSVLTVVNPASSAALRIGLNNTSNNFMDADNNIFRNSAGSEAMRINSSGNVGIGTASPSAFLHTEGTSNGTESYAKFSTGSAAGDQILTVKSGSSRDHMALQVNSGSGAVDDLALNPDGGNVGIGTASPDQTLHVHKASAGSVSALSDSVAVFENSTHAYLSILAPNDKQTGIIFGDAASNNVASIAYDHNTDDLGISAGDDTIFTNNGSERLRITSAGNVGIGTTSPDNALHVQTAALSGRSASNGNTLLTLEHSTDTGIQFFSATQTQLRFGDAASTGAGSIIYEHSDNNLRLNTGAITTFETGGNERLRIDSSGNVGIGTDSPSQLLNLKANTPFIQFIQDGSDSFAGINFGDADDANDGQILYDHDSRFMRFQVANNERLRIDSSGRTYIGTTSTTPAFGTSTGICFNVGDATHISAPAETIFNRTASEGTLISCRKGGTQVGSISVTASATAYNTSSDARLKDVTGSARGLEVINELNPVAYNWKADGKADEGLIAQEVLDVVPNAVSGSEEDMYQMDYSKLVVHLVAGMKEQQEQIESLKSEIANLTGE